MPWQLGKLVFSQVDNSNKNITWLGVKEKFIASFNAKTGKLTEYNKKLEDLDDDEKPTVTCLLSMKSKVWVGTDIGLFQIDQAKGKVIQLAINFEIIKCKVISLSALGDGFKVETNKGSFDYHFKENKWVKSKKINP